MNGHRRRVLNFGMLRLFRSSLVAATSVTLIFGLGSTAAAAGEIDDQFETTQSTEIVADVEVIGNIQNIAIKGGRVTVVGKKTVGSTLTAKASTFKPTPTAVAFTWYRNDSIVIGNGSSYKLQPADIGQAIRVRAVAQVEGYIDSAEVVSKAVNIPVPRFIGGRVKISGNKTVGSTLTAKATTFKPTPASVVFTWYRDGSKVIGYGSTYKLQPTDVGGNIRVRAVAQAEGYSDSREVASAPFKIPVPKFSGGRVTVSGTKSVGSTLTAKATTFKPTPASVVFTWYRNGSMVVGSGATYRVQAGDGGQTITVRAIAKSNGYIDSTPVSSGAITIASQIAKQFTTGKAVITGTPRPGNLLTVNVSGFAPNPSSYVYQWQRNGVNINGATGNAYQVVSSDVGTSIKVVVTAKLENYADSKIASNPVDVMAVLVQWQYKNCTEVWNVLGRPIRRGEPGFHSGLDRDNDGVGCEYRPR